MLSKQIICERDETQRNVIYEPGAPAERVQLTMGVFIKLSNLSKRVGNIFPFINSPPAMGVTKTTKDARARSRPKSAEKSSAMAIKVELLSVSSRAEIYFVRWSKSFSRQLNARTNGKLIFHSPRPDCCAPRAFFSYHTRYPFNEPQKNIEAVPLRHSVTRQMIEFLSHAWQR